MNSPPVIGISPSVSDGFIRMRPNYAEAVMEAGGIPVFLPHTEEPDKLFEYTAMLDGIIFAGGADVDPKYYGEEKQFDSVEVTESRDAFELALFPIFYATGKPILGICRGLQLINVALGGTLNQHIEGHRQTEGREVFDRIANLTPGSRLQDICSGESQIHTNSFHHQSIKDTANGLRISAIADDMTIEAVEDTNHPFLLAVQWHPEMFYRQDSNARALIKEFVDAAKKQ